MSVEEARKRYRALQSELRMAAVAHGRQKWLHRPQNACQGCHDLGLAIDAASIDLDNAVAEEHPAEPPLSLVAY